MKRFRVAAAMLIALLATATMVGNLSAAEPGYWLFCDGNQLFKTIPGECGVPYGYCDGGEWSVWVDGD